MVVRRARARDPADVQIARARASAVSIHTSQSVGRFHAWDPEWGAWPLSCQQERLLHEINARTSEQWITSVLIPFIHDDPAASDGSVSLRLLDWMVTNYSKCHHVVIDGFAVFQGYCDARNIYQCRSFDPFRRKLKLSFFHAGTMMHTTVGQINFILWAHEHKLLEYVRTHKAALEQDMNTKCGTLRLQRKQACGADGKKRPRQPLSAESNVVCRIVRPRP